MKGICFKEPLFNATVEGRKTQTRRIMKPQPYLLKTTNETQWLRELNLRPNELNGDFKPRYKVGDIVYLKEPYRYFDKSIFEVELQYKYRGDIKLDWDYKVIDSWENKLFMPAEAARYFIEITGVNAERLQDISDTDCEKEGICPVWENSFVIGWNNKSSKVVYENRRQAYAALINQINGRGTWEANPYVWVYDYKLCDVTI